MSQTSFIHHPCHGRWVEHIPVCTRHLTPWTGCSRSKTHTNRNKGRLTDIFRVLLSFMGLVGVSKHIVRNTNNNWLQHIEYVRYAFVMSPCGGNNTQVLKGATSNKLIKLGCHDSCDRQNCIRVVASSDGLTVGLSFYRFGWNFSTIGWIT